MFNGFPFCLFWGSYSLPIYLWIKWLNLVMLPLVCVPSLVMPCWHPTCQHHSFLCQNQALPCLSLSLDCPAFLQETHGFPPVICTLSAPSRGEIYLQHNPVIIAYSYFGGWRRGQCSCLWLWPKSEGWTNSSWKFPLSSCCFLWVPSTPHP